MSRWIDTSPICLLVSSSTTEANENSYTHVYVNCSWVINCNCKSCTDIISECKCHTNSNILVSYECISLIICISITIRPTFISDLDTEDSYVNLVCTSLTIDTT